MNVLDKAREVERRFGCIVVGFEAGTYVQMKGAEYSHWGGEDIPGHVLVVGSRTTRAAWDRQWQYLFPNRPSENSPGDRFYRAKLVPKEVVTMK